MRAAFINRLMALAEEDERIMLITGDLGFSVLEQFMNKFDKRFINVGVAEQNMSGIAAGLALSNKIVITYSIANFTTLRCIEQIRDDICYHNLNVKIVSVGAGFSYGTQGYTHYGLEDIAIMRSLPNMTVFSPSDPVETELALNAAIDIPGPCYLRLGKAKENIIHTNQEEIKKYHITQLIPVIKAETTKTILTTGPITALIQEQIVQKNLDYSLWSVPCIKPLDEEGLRHIADEADYIITLEEHQLSGGFGAAILEAYEKLYNKQKISRFPNIKRMGINDFIPKDIGSQAYMRKYINMELI